KFLLPSLEESMVAAGRRGGPRSREHELHIVPHCALVNADAPALLQAFRCTPTHHRPKGAVGDPTGPARSRQEGASTVFQATHRDDGHAFWSERDAQVQEKKGLST